MKTFTPTNAKWTIKQIVAELNEYLIDCESDSHVTAKMITNKIAQEFVDASFEILQDGVDQSEDEVMENFLDLNEVTLEKLGIYADVER